MPEAGPRGIRNSAGRGLAPRAPSGEDSSQAHTRSRRSAARLPYHRDLSQKRRHHFIDTERMAKESGLRVIYARLALHTTFVVSALLLAYTDRLISSGAQKQWSPEP